MKLSVVTTLYNSRKFLQTFINEILDAIHELKIDEFELLFVNDGSPDDSLQYLIGRKDEIPQIKIIDLSRNFGHHYAIQAGLNCSKGDYIFLIDNDLETPPKFLITCFNKMETCPSADVIYGYQEKRKGKLVESVGGQIFWWALNIFSDIYVPENILTERLMTKKYVENLLRLGDANLFIAGMMHWTGFEQIGIPVTKSQREGESTYSTGKRFQLMMMAITSFSGKPLEYLFFIGLIITIGSLIAIVYLMMNKLIFGDSVQLGWTSLVALNILILGIISTFLGLIGIYLYKVFKQVQNRPNYIINEIY
jgi:putative glycosyltransferase